MPGASTSTELERFLNIDFRKNSQVTTDGGIQNSTVVRFEDLSGYGIALFGIDQIGKIPLTAGAEVVGIEVVGIVTPAGDQPMRRSGGGKRMIDADEYDRVSAHEKGELQRRIRHGSADPDTAGDIGRKCPIRPIEKERRAVAVLGVHEPTALPSKVNRDL